MTDILEKISTLKSLVKEYKESSGLSEIEKNKDIQNKKNEEEALKLREEKVKNNLTQIKLQNKTKREFNLGGEIVFVSEAILDNSIVTVNKDFLFSNNTFVDISLEYFNIIISLIRILNKEEILRFIKEQQYLKKNLEENEYYLIFSKELNEIYKIEDKDTRNTKLKELQIKQENKMKEIEETTKNIITKYNFTIKKNIDILVLKEVIKIVFKGDIYEYISIDYAHEQEIVNLIDIIPANANNRNNRNNNRERDPQYDGYNSDRSDYYEEEE